MALGDQKSNQEAYTPSFLTIDSRRAQPNKKKHSCVCVCGLNLIRRRMCVAGHTQDS
jgi:hypothetical protein